MTWRLHLSSLMLWCLRFPRGLHGCFRLPSLVLWRSSLPSVLHGSMTLRLPCWVFWSLARLPCVLSLLLLRSERRLRPQVVHALLVRCKLPFRESNHVLANAQLHLRPRQHLIMLTEHRLCLQVPQPLLVAHCLRPHLLCFMHIARAVMACLPCRLRVVPLVDVKLPVFHVEILDHSLGVLLRLPLKHLGLLLLLVNPGLEPALHMPRLVVSSLLELPVVLDLSVPLLLQLRDLEIRPVLLELRLGQPNLVSVCAKCGEVLHLLPRQQLVSSLSLLELPNLRHGAQVCCLPIVDLGLGLGQRLVNKLGAHLLVRGRRLREQADNRLLLEGWNMGKACLLHWVFCDQRLNRLHMLYWLVLGQVLHCCC
mmetsp:Transcript_57377/g.117470  ORF Transcript_57377/g.117470 Transcript_57377/m.117470 type:complete len:367 (+) Transcript_57377:143-1243(+)